MGCLNSEGKFKHWFGNIHLSGPCNRSCYFCIGQHMMALDSFNTLKSHPLPGIDEFCVQCRARGVSEINLTGTNTDPLLYHFIPELRNQLGFEIPRLQFGLRTNGAILDRFKWRTFDKASISIPCFDQAIYKKIMGSGCPPDLKWIRKNGPSDLKVNVVLCPENIEELLLLDTLRNIQEAGIKQINLREPYGQPHIGDPLVSIVPPTTHRFGMPVYHFEDLEVMYWDVHYVEVESVNLYASGRVSIDYPITRGHDESGIVLDQSRWLKSGRQFQQWIKS